MATKTNPALDPANTAILFSKTAQEVQDETKRRLGRAREMLNGILAVPGRRTVANTLVPYDEMSRLVAETSMQTELAFNVLPDAASRDAAEKGYQAAMALASELNLNRPLYEAFAALDVTKESKETQFAVSKILRDFRRAGVDRDDATRAKIQKLQEGIAAIGAEFDRNIRDDTRSIKVKRKDLAGLPRDFIAAHPPGEDGLVTLTTNYPDALPVLSYAKSADVRRELMGVFRNRAYPANITVLDKMLAERYELAKLLGHEHYADFVTEDKMVKSAQAVAKFIEKVVAASQPRAREDYAMFLKRKRRDARNAKSLDQWDRAYYEELVRAEQFRFDSRKMRPYFPFAQVRDGLFTITKALFGVRYARVNKPAWHPAVETYDLFEGPRRIGRFYLDLHPREGKYNHAASFSVVTGKKGAELPQATLVCNFPDPAQGPALMTYVDVLTFFHEFGHLLHGLLSGHSRWAKTAMGEIEWDFVEVPSQLMEEWVRDPGTLALFAKHYETGKPIPASLVERLRQSEAVGRGLDTLRQMYLAALSLNYYDRDPTGLDTTQMAKDLNAKYDPIPWFEDTHTQCGFGHLNNYSAVYYTYCWSLVIAKDLFRAFEKTGNLLDPAMSRKYRKLILDAGSTRPAKDMVREFLGRDTRFDAFAKWLGEGIGAKPAPTPRRGASRASRRAPARRTSPRARKRAGSGRSRRAGSARTRARRAQARR